MVISEVLQCIYARTPLLMVTSDALWAELT